MNAGSSLSNETARAYLVAAGGTFRKHNAGIVLVTQSFDDLRSTGILEPVLEVCPTRILLAHPAPDLAETARIFRLNEKETELYAGLIPEAPVSAEDGQPGESAQCRSRSARSDRVRQFSL